MNKLIENVPNFKVGDQVICIDDIGVNELQKGRVYIITELFKEPNSKGRYRCHIKDIQSFYGLYSSRFMLQVEYDANKYNI